MRLRPEGRYGLRGLGPRRTPPSFQSFLTQQPNQRALAAIMIRGFGAPVASDPPAFNFPLPHTTPFLNSAFERLPPSLPPLRPQRFPLPLLLQLKIPKEGVLGLFLVSGKRF